MKRPAKLKINEIVKTRLYYYRDWMATSSTTHEKDERYKLTSTYPNDGNKNKNLFNEVLYLWKWTFAGLLPDGANLEYFKNQDSRQIRSYVISIKYKSRLPKPRISLGT